MYCVRKVLEDLWWVGGNDRRLAMFEGVYAVPNGVSYNSYLLLDDKTVLFDTVDPSVSKVFFENIDHVLAGRKLDYLVIHHMEPDHSGTVSEVLLRHPETVIVCSDRIRATLPQPQVHASEPGTVDNQAMFALSYGLFVLSAREGERDNACIINTAAQVTDTPKRISITVNKQNLTHDMILKTGVFNLSVLSQDASFAQFQQYGFRSGRDTADKFDGAEAVRTANGLRYEPAGTNAVLSGKVIQTLDCGTHTLFLAEVTEARVLSDVPSATYAYYFEHIKPKPQPAAEKKTGFVCKICGYVYEGETLPADYICPLCKHGAEDFEPLK